MVMLVELMEDSGPVVSGHGITRITTTNIGWKNSDSDETHSYAYYPIIRPDTGTIAAYSYVKYNYLKISGVYTKASRPRVKITASSSRPTGYTGTGSVQLLYNITSTYGGPSNAVISGTPLWAGNTYDLLVSTTGPETATLSPDWLNANTTYYTQYLQTQLVVPVGAVTNFGNIPELTIKFYVDEYETGDL